jgi:DNA topoisomerase VI subunit B
MEKTLKREIFETSRLSEYFNEKEMRAQIGMDKEYWPIAVLRELIDNSLDACEAAGIPPVIDVGIKGDTISVTDNGKGIPAKTVKRSLDYLYRVSDKAYYIAPMRGQMGNALKVIYAVPYVCTGKGYVEITASGKKHHIIVSLDRITGEPKIEYKKSQFVKNGTSVKIQWENSTRLLCDPECDYFTKPPTPDELIENYSAFNPHATFTLNGQRYEPTDTAWQKWRPDMPTSAHWYNTETLRDLVAGYLAGERRNGQHNKTVREFVSEFRGLSGTTKQKKVAGDFAREHLSMFEKGGDIDTGKLARLLDAMQQHSKPPRPQHLGIIGQDHFTAWMLSQGAAKESIKYSKKQGTDQHGMQYVVEVGFAVNNNDQASRKLITGLNWSPVIGNIPDETIRSAVQQARLDPHDPVIFVIHVARPRLEFMDRGKTKIAL